MKALFRTACLTLTPLLLSACAHGPNANPQDPYEPFNRQMFKINYSLDRTVMRPSAVIYNSLVPPPIQQGVSNAFNNLLGPEAIINDILQGRPGYALLDFLRTVVNSTIGVAGIFDVAKHMGLPTHGNDFGKTYALWRHRNESPYLMVPFFGPSTARDTVGLFLAAGTNPLFYINNNVVTYLPFALYYINLRAQLLPLDKLVDQSFDPYSAVRDAYLQRRNAAVAANTSAGDYCSRRGLPAEQPLSHYVAQGANIATTDNDALDDFSLDAQPANSTSSNQTHAKPSPISTRNSTQHR